MIIVSSMLGMCVQSIVSTELWKIDKKKDLQEDIKEIDILKLLVSRYFNPYLTNFWFLVMFYLKEDYIQSLYIFQKNFIMKIINSKDCDGSQTGEAVLKTARRLPDTCSFNKPEILIWYAQS